MVILYKPVIILVSWNITGAYLIAQVKVWSELHMFMTCIKFSCPSYLYLDSKFQSAPQIITKFFRKYVV
jgi:hypothetical protein